MSNLPPLPDEFEAWIKTRAICLFLNPSSIDDQVIIYMRQAWQEAVKQERERLDAIERMGPNGTIRIDDEHGLCPRYIHWGGSTGLTIRDAIDIAIDLAAIRARSQEGQSEP